MHQIAASERAAALRLSSFCNHKGTPRQSRQSVCNIWTSRIASMRLMFWDRRCFTVMARERKWSLNRVETLAQLFQTRGEFRKQAPRAYSAAARNGWLDRICRHMERAGTDWTLSECREIAAQYNCKSAFKVNANPAYQSARRKGWLKEICSHMQSGSHRKT